MKLESYYNPMDLPRFPEIGKDAPELAAKFFEYYAQVFSEGELTEREKALIALAVAHAIQCPYSTDAYTQACLEKGSNVAEMTEALLFAEEPPWLTAYRCAPWQRRCRCDTVVWRSGGSIRTHRPRTLL